MRGAYISAMLAFERQVCCHNNGLHLVIFLLVNTMADPLPIPPPPAEGDDSSDVIEKLTGFLKEQDISIEEDEDTADLINKISDQISKMLDEPKATGTTDRSVLFICIHELCPHFSQAQSKLALGPVKKNNPPVVELPAYPTPYEIWKMKHEVVNIFLPPKSDPTQEVSTSEERHVSQHVFGQREWDNLVEK
jgi:hypothetical protein